MKLWIRFFIFVKIFLHRFDENKLSTNAGYLTYSTMLALVPLLMVIFSVISAFPIFKSMSGELQEFIFTNFVPSAGGAVQGYLNAFILNSKQMSIIGILGLITVALMLIFSIDSTLNDIWPNTSSRTLFFSVAIYWMILTLGPLLLGVGIAISSYLYALQVFNATGEVSTVGSVLKNALSVIPFILTWFMFTLIYTVVPNTKVNVRYAACGALIATIFFSLGKKAFSWYVIAFPSYHLIYGALAILPILIVWIQLSWLFVLLGAQLSAVLEDMRLLKAGMHCFSEQKKVLKDKALESQVFALYKKIGVYQGEGDDRINSEG